MSTTFHAYKRLQEASSKELDQMMGWVIYGMENTNHDHAKMKKDFTKKFGAAATKKHWDDLVSQAMGD